MISDATIEAVKAATDLPTLVREYGVTLRKIAGGYTACCPFHDEKSPSFRVNTNGKFKNEWHCFGSCATGGGAISFVMRIASVGYREAVTVLADRAGISIDSGKSNRLQRAANAEDIPCSEWFWKRHWDRLRKALDEAMTLPDIPPDDEWADTLGRLLRGIEAMKPEDRLQQFQFMVKGGDRATWRAEVTVEKAFTDAWMGMAWEAK